MNGPFTTNVLPDRVDGKCIGFAWVGQSFACCDVCGEPFWEHTHDRQYVDGSEALVLIRPELAAAVRAKWGPR